MRRSLARFALVAALGPLALAACWRPAPGVRPVPLADPATGGTYVVTLGADTIAVEQFTRSANRIEGDVITRQPNTRVTHYVLELGPDGMARTAELRIRKPDGTMLPGVVSDVRMTFGADSVTTTATVGDKVTTRTIAARGAFPSIPTSFVVWEQALVAARAAKRDTVDIALVGPGASAAAILPAALAGRDSARVWYFGSPMRLTVDRAGHLLTLSGDETTNKVHVQRVGPVSIATLATAFGSRDASGHALGIASPRDTARATIGGAELWVDYGRPSRRGRDVWADGVLGDTLWRTGANAATQFHTPKDIELGGKLVPAGTYTLFTHAARGGYELIVNKQVGQWGTEYHPERDLLRVTLIESLAPDTEQFTFLITPSGNDTGTLAMRWGRKELSVPIRVR